MFNYEILFERFIQLLAIFFMRTNLFVQHRFLNIMFSQHDICNESFFNMVCNVTPIAQENTVAFKVDNFV